MPEYARVVTFEADEAAVEALVNEINASDSPLKVSLRPAFRCLPTAPRDG